MMKRFLTGAAISALALTLASGAALAQKTKLTVYTALEADQIGPYKQAIEADIPEVDITFVRDSTGVITARFLAEKANPQADVIFALAATSLLMFESQGLLETYKPNGAEKLKPVFLDPKEPYTWTGHDAFLSVVCYNTLEGEKAKVKAPESWQDLLKPEFKGKIVMPHPASSGTGYLTIAGWLQIMGEKAGWEYMDKLHDNIAVYTHSGSAPCVQAAKGERTVGIGFDMRGAREKSQGAPIDIILPKEGATWDMEATAIVKGTKKLELAKKVADWSTGLKANQLYGKYYAIVSHPDVKSAPANYPANAETAMMKNDFAWMADNRERILAEWVKRYESKAAPK